MGTKEEIFNKIGDLLQDLNAQYLTLSEQQKLPEISELLLLEAKGQSVAAYITLLKANIVLKEEPSQNTLNSAALASKKIAFNDYFTPPSAIRTSAQSVTESDTLTAEAASPKELIAADANAVSEEEVKSESEDVVEDEEVINTAEEPILTDNADFSEPESITPAHTAAIEQAEEPTLVVTEVIEEQKEVVIEQPQEVVIQEEINTVVEEVPARPLTLNEIISQQKQAGVQNRVYQVSQSGSTDKLTDIKAGISLNDKLLFIKDLFNGYSLAYSEAVELLNRFTSYAEADAFLQTNYAIKNKWAEKPHTVEKLYAVLRKRYH